MKVKNIVVMILGRNIHDIKYLESAKVKFPKECELKREFKGPSLGIASNFRKEGTKILCDINLNEKLDDRTIAPLVKYTIELDDTTMIVSNFSIIGMGAIDKHADPTLTNNINKAGL